MLECILCSYVGSYQLNNHISIWFWVDWITYYPKNGGNYALLDKTPMLLQTGFYLMFRKPWLPNLNHSDFKNSARALVHECDPSYLKPIILTFLGTSRLAQNGQFGELAI